MKSSITGDDMLVQEDADEILFSQEKDDEKLFSQLYDQFSPALYGLIVKWVKERSLAETILENAFVNAWHSRKFYDIEKERIFTWLYRITYNTATHYLKNKV
jgi:DNA-directed RNA polymerase specialized sigma24 family protein